MQEGTAEATTGSFPEWLILFGLTYDSHHIRIIAYVPQRHELDPDVTDCAIYIVDQLPLYSDSVTSVPVSLCERVFVRLRLVMALTTLRRHVLHLSKWLCDDIGRTNKLLGCHLHHSDDSESRKQCASLGSGSRCSSEYSTCPSSVHAREFNDAVDLECGEEVSSSCKSLASSFCSTCSSLLESTSTSDSCYSEDSKFTNSSNCMELPTGSLSRGSNQGRACANKLTETKRQIIIAWAREVIPTEHPVKDTYKMTVHHHHPRRRRVATPNQVHADRHY